MRFSFVCAFDKINHKPNTINPIQNSICQMTKRSSYPHNIWDLTQPRLHHSVYLHSWQSSVSLCQDRRSYILRQLTIELMLPIKPHFDSHYSISTTKEEIGKDIIQISSSWQQYSVSFSWYHIRHKISNIYLVLWNQIYESHNRINDW